MAGRWLLAGAHKGRRPALAGDLLLGGTRLGRSRFFSFLSSGGMTMSRGLHVEKVVMRCALRTTLGGCTSQQEDLLGRVSVVFWLGRKMLALKSSAAHRQQRKKG